MNFKQGISPIQIEALKARQFVIVDVAMPPAPQSPNKKGRHKDEDVFMGKDADQIQMVKSKIIKEKLKHLSHHRNVKLIPPKNSR